MIENLDNLAVGKLFDTHALGLHSNLLAVAVVMGLSGHYDFPKTSTASGLCGDVCDAQRRVAHLSS